MKKKNNIFENKLQELDKLTIESKKEVFSKEKKEQEEKDKLKKLNEARAIKFLKDYDKERTELKKFIKEVNKRFYKKYEINVINPYSRNTEGLYCKETGGFASLSFNLIDVYEINIFVFDVLNELVKFGKHTTTGISLTYVHTKNPNWPTHFRVEVGTSSFYNPDFIREDFKVEDHGSNTSALAIEDFMNKLTDLIKKL